MADAFRATYSDWKVVKGRKVVQVVLELPLETADEAYQVLGGMPLAANEIWCAVARLNELPQRVVDKPLAETSPRPVTVLSEPVGDDSLGYCVAVAMGGPRCVGRCEVPKDCGAKPLPSPDKPPKSPAQIAGYLCTLGSFQQFLRSRVPAEWAAGVRNPDNTSVEEIAADAVRDYCGVRSRSEITQKNANWSALLLAYRLWEKEAEVVPA